MNSIVTLSIPSAFSLRGKLTRIHVKNATSHSGFHNNNKRQKLTKALRKIGCDLEKTANQLFQIATFRTSCQTKNNTQPTEQYHGRIKTIWPPQQPQPQPQPQLRIKSSQEPQIRKTKSPQKA